MEHIKPFKNQVSLPSLALHCVVLTYGRARKVGWVRPALGLAGLFNCHSTSDSEEVKIPGHVRSRDDIGCRVTRVE